MTAPRIVQMGLLVLAAAQLGWYLPRLPDRVAASFGLNGVPNGYDGKGAFLAWYVASLLVIVAMFQWLPYLMRRLPPSLINMPNADYWLAPERRESTVADLAEGLGWFGVVTVSFVIWTFHLTILANLETPPVLASGPFWSGFAAYMGYVAWWVVRLVRRYGRVGG